MSASPTPEPTTPPQVPNLNIANVITVLRLILVPVFVVVLWPGETAAQWWAGFVVFVIAAATDKLDGYLARSRGLITDFGKLADSIADKALIIAALIVLSILTPLPWWVTILMIARELGITLMRMAMVKREVMAAGGGGKLKMALQVLFIAILLVPWHSFLSPGWADIAVWIGIALAIVTLVVSLWSAGQYVRDAIRIARGDR